MGIDKGLLKLDGKTFVERVVNTLKEIFDSVAVISERKASYASVGVPVYPDIFRNCGPLGGIHTALKMAQTEAVFVASCDLAFLTSSVVFSIIDKPMRGDAMVASADSRVQPLCGVYSRQCLQVLEERLKSRQLSVLEFLRTVSTSIIDVSEDRLALMNINTPVEYTQALELHSGRK